MSPEKPINLSDNDPFTGATAELRAEDMTIVRGMLKNIEKVGAYLHPGMETELPNFLQTASLEEWEKMQETINGFVEAKKQSLERPR